MKGNKTGAPEVWISSWVETDSSGQRLERGIRLFWRLPDNAYAMMVEVDEVEWGPFTDFERALLIPYPDEERRINEDPIRVRLRYLEYGKELELRVLNPVNDINLVLADVILMRDGSPGSDTYCPAENYLTRKTAAYVDSYWEISYSDKYSNGRYRAVYLTITPPGNQGVVTCAIHPGASTGASEISDALYTESACSAMQGEFAGATIDNQEVAQVQVGSETVTIRTFRDTDTDSMIVQVVAPSDFTVNALLHEE